MDNNVSFDLLLVNEKLRINDYDNNNNNLEYLNI